MRIGRLRSMLVGMLTCACWTTSCDREADDATVEMQSALAISSASLSLQVLTSSCGANQVQDFFNVTNTGTTSVALSSVSIKLWADDTSASNLVAQINTGGCLTDAAGSCVHQVTGVIATPTRFAPACGPDAGHQANWEITISTTDGTLLRPGQSWRNIQSAVHLASFANFSPGTSSWYSGCLPGTTYTADPHFGLYQQGNLVYANGIAAPECRAPKGTRQLSGFRKPPIANASFVRAVPETTPITLSLSLPVRQPTGFPTLPDFVKQVSDPASPQYRQYLSQQDFVDRYAPTTSDYQAIVAWAQSVGLTVRTVSSRMVVSASGPASVIKKALFANLNYYRRPDGSAFYAPDREPSLNLNTPLVEIGALDNYIARRPANTDWGSNRILENGYGFGDGAFGFGQGECVGLFADDGFSLGDLTGLNGQRNIYKEHPELTPPSFRAVLLGSNFLAGQPAPLTCVDGITPCGPNPGCPASTPNCCPRPDPNNAGKFIIDFVCQTTCAADEGTATTGSACRSGLNDNALEIQADIEMAQALAAGLKEVVVYEGGTTDTTLAAMADDPAKCHQLSSSWRMPLEPRTRDLLLQLAAQGQAFSVSSGDDGAIGDTADMRRLAEVTVVGGTILTGVQEAPNPVRFDYVSETPWPQSGSLIADGTSGAPAVPLPDYQHGVNMSFCSGGSFCAGSTQFRNVPDVAMVSSDMEIIFGGISSSRPSLSGTSISSPLWASFMAVTNGYGAKNGIAPVGFANPAIYTIGKTRGTANDLYKDTFHDLASGTTSSYSPACGLFHDCSAPAHTQAPGWPAVTGYDLASGWGSPTPKLVQALTTGLPPPTTTCTKLPGAPGVPTDLPSGSADLISSFFITGGLDCNVWFTGASQTQGFIGKITPDTNVVSLFPIPGWVQQFSIALGITSGLDGNLYFAAELNTIQHVIGKVGPGGTITTLDVTAAASIPGTFQVAAARDGIIWFTTHNNQIGATDTSLRTVEGFPLPNTNAETYGITLGPDGNMWFTDDNNNQFGRITPLGDIRIFNAPGPSTAAPLGITAGSDGNIWFVQQFGGPDEAGQIVVASTNGDVLGSFPFIAPERDLISIAAGPDGNIWFTEDAGPTERIAKINPSTHVINEFAVPTPSGTPTVQSNGIAAGPDGNIWFTEETAGRFGKMTPP